VLVGVRVAVKVGVGVTVRLGVAVAVGVGVGVAVGVGVGVAVGVSVGVAVGVSVGVAVGVSVGVAVGVVSKSTAPGETEGNWSMVAMTTARGKIIVFRYSPNPGSTEVRKFLSLAARRSHPKQAIPWSP
jgi:hypothetical protein